MRSSLLFRMYCCLFAAACCLSCGESDTLYARMPAKFIMDNIYSVPQLYTACNSMGEFCTIYGSNNQYIFASPTGSTPINKTALSQYSGFYLGLSGGFIVGLPNIPEMGRDVPVVVCFDLACSNCYDEGNIAKRLILQEGGFAYCSRCHRTYDLNNLGIVSLGEGGRSLFRYRVNYIASSGSLIINN
ncbi:MAG: hypothetical protein J5661_05670 [Bacteroidaceae bacterium]|nr:hypothetical protein [Bacteroidaceae bacterium]